MSLLNGMNNLFENKAAALEAEFEMAFEDMEALEADMIVDAMTGNDAPYVSDDDNDIIDEDDDEALLAEAEDMDAEECGGACMEEKLDVPSDEELKKDLPDEEKEEDTEPPATVAEGDATATEAAALKGQSFLSSLTRIGAEPLLATKDGSVGQDDSAADHDKNYHDEANHSVEKILATLDGSVGSEDSAADHDKNFHEEFDDDNDPIKATFGSYGQKDSTAKDPASESMNVFDMINQAALEGAFGPEDPDNEHTHDNTIINEMNKDAKVIGLEAIDINSIIGLVKNKDYKGALEALSAYGDTVDLKMNEIILNEGVESTNLPYAYHLKTSLESLIVSTSSEQMISAAIESGMDEKYAKMNTINKLMNHSEELKKTGELNPVTEAAINRVVTFLKATEGCDKSEDPECTEDGSVGQKDSKANSADNFTDGAIDASDPIKTEDGGEGQKDSAAEFDDNHSGGAKDDNDPIVTDDGSVGQKDSTAKDPVAESYRALEELERLSAEIEEQD